VCVACVCGVARRRGVGKIRRHRRGTRVVSRRSSRLSLLSDKIVGAPAADAAGPGRRGGRKERGLANARRPRVDSFPPSLPLSQRRLDTSWTLTMGGRAAGAPGEEGDRGGRGKAGSAPVLVTGPRGRGAAAAAPGGPAAASRRAGHARAAYGTRRGSATGARLAPARRRAARQIARPRPAPHTLRPAPHRAPSGPHRSPVSLLSPVAYDFKSSRALPPVAKV